jgi:hypothetical protein
MSPVKYELSFYIPEDDILRSPRRENVKSYITLNGWTVKRRRNVSSVKYELGYYISEDDILHSYRYETLKSYIRNIVCEYNFVIPSSMPHWKHGVSK